MVDRATNTELFDTTHYMAGEWMQMTYDSIGGAGPIHNYRHTYATKVGYTTPSTATNKNGDLTFERLGNNSQGRVDMH